jgi:DNA polymerase III delta prime subunit
MTHHAYYIEGPLSQFVAFKEELKPFWASAFERFGIDEARELRTLASLKNFEDSTFLIAASSITTEAQQALLKLLEEPQARTTFVLLVPHGALLPTLRSRMLKWEGRPVAQKVLGTQAASFLKSSGKARSEQIAELLKDEEGERERVREFVNALESILAEKIKEPQVRAGLADVAKVRSYLSDRSPSLKMLLEHLALSLPQLK